MSDSQPKTEINLLELMRHHDDIQAALADKAGYDALVQRCYLLEDELAEVQKRLATHKDQTADIMRLEGERDKLFADLAEERKETAAAKAQAAKEKKARISAGPKSASQDAELERRLRWARKLNGHLLALIRKLRGIIADLESGKRTRGKLAAPGRGHIPATANH